MEIFPYRGGQYRRNDRDNGPQGLVNIAGMAAFPLEKIHLQVVSIAGMGGQDDRRGWSGWIGIYKNRNCLYRRSCYPSGQHI
jgi:hypothetical protein